jgi:hypothetical protein
MASAIIVSMPTKTSKDKHKLIVTEFECRPLNEDGDSIDVWHFETEEEALAAAREHISGGGLAAAVEKHVTRYPMYLFDEGQTFTTLAVFGDRKILELWGWEPGETTWLDA